MKEKVDRLFEPLQIAILYFFNFIFKFIKLKKVVMIVGVDEIANCTYYFKNVFQREAISVNFSSNKYYINNKYDYMLNIKNKYFLYIARLFYGPYLLAKLSNQSDIFLYFWWTGFCVDREMDYKFLKNKNKKIVCIFVGDDIRSRKLLKEKLEKENIDSYVFYDHYNFEINEKRVKRVALLADKYSDLNFSVKKSQMSYLKDSIDNFTYMINDNILKNDKYSTLIDGKIKILHAPSNPILKGTPLVRAAIKKLQIEGYDFEYIELQNRPNEEVLKLLEESNIVLNQFYADMPGVFGIESMAKKNAVLMSADYKNLPTNGKKPWLMTNYWELYDNIKYLLDNPHEIKRYADIGYKFVKNNYRGEKVRDYYINIFYENNIIDDKSIFTK